MRQNGYFTKQVILSCIGPRLHHTDLARSLPYTGALGEAGRALDLPMDPSVLGLRRSASTPPRVNLRMVVYGIIISEGFLSPNVR